MNNLTTFLRKGKIIDDNESVEHMNQRVFSALARESRKYEREPEKNRADFWKTLFMQKKMVPCTSILTNAGRYQEKPLTACSVPPVDNLGRKKQLEKIVSEYHAQGMGTGFNFDTSEDPESELLFLNSYAEKEFAQNKLERPVGNMGILSISHPRVKRFLSLKTGAGKHKNWKFNISINTSDEFMRAVKKGGCFQLDNGRYVNAEDLFNEITYSAHECGDPGLVFLHRFEEHNVTPHLGKYISLAPCGEVPLASGETCQFSYINLNAYAQKGGIDYDSLRSTVHEMVVLLDNALDVSIKNFGNMLSRRIALQKRKIGIGVCGFSDLLFSLGLPYGCDESLRLAEDIISFINFESKKASLGLARKRGPFPAFNESGTRREIIVGRYLGKSTSTVSSRDWEQLYNDVMRHGIRHVSTIALPPTGRSSFIIGASPSIEPCFRVKLSKKVQKQISHYAGMEGYKGDMKAQMAVIRDTGSLQGTDLPEKVKEIYKTCIELAPERHIEVVSAFQHYTDDAISKTVNLPSRASVDQVGAVYMMAYDYGMKGVTVFRDNCKDQPRRLTN